MPRLAKMNRPLEKNNLLNVITIFLVAIIPLLTIGFDFLERTGLYQYVFGIVGVEKAIKYKLTTQYGDASRLTISQENDKKEFNDLWKLIKSNTETRLPKGTPKFISRFAVENGTYVYIPQDGGRKQIILIPESVPVAAMHCPENAKEISDCDGKIIGSVGDLIKWLDDKRSIIRIKIDLLITLTSVLLGLYTYLASRKIPGVSKDI